MSGIPWNDEYKYIREQDREDEEEREEKKWQYTQDHWDCGFENDRESLPSLIPATKEIVKPVASSKVKKSGWRRNLPKWDGVSNGKCRICDGPSETLLCEKCCEKGLK